MNLLDAVGVLTIMILVFMLIKGMSLGRMIIVLFASSCILFILRISLEKQDALIAFLDSFGFLTIVGFVIVIYNYIKKKNRIVN